MCWLCAIPKTSFFAIKILKFSFYSSLISFDELLELSQRGDNSTIDMLVGDIYGGMDYSKVYPSTQNHVFFLSVIRSIFLPIPLWAVFAALARNYSITKTIVL